MHKESGEVRLNFSISRRAAETCGDVRRPQRSRRLAFRYGRSLPCLEQVLQACAVPPSRLQLEKRRH